MKTEIRPENEMKDSGIEWIGDIPENWTIRPVKSLYNLTTGFTPNSQDESLYDENGETWVTIGDLKDDIIFNSKQKISKKVADAHRTEMTKKGSLMYSFKLSVGRVAFAGKDLFTNEAIASLFPKNEYGNLHYLKYASSLIIGNANTNIYGAFIMNQKLIFNAPLPLPSLFEQQAIADYLDEVCSQIDEIIVEAKASIEEYKELKRSVITEAVLLGLKKNAVKHSNIEWISDYNAEFGMTRIGRFCFVTKLAGFEYTNAVVDSITTEIGVPIVRAQNVKMFKFLSGKIEEFIPEDISFQLKRSSLDKKCLLITFIGAGIGDVCVFDEDERYHLAPNVAKIEIFDKYKCLLDEHYLMYYLGSEAGQGEIRKISKASAQPSLSMETIRSINVVLPPIDIQKNIVEYLNKKMLHIDSLITEKESLIADLEAYKKSLIYELVTGKRRVV